MYDPRINKVRETLRDKGIDSLLISNFFNILYLTGFKTLTKDEREAFVLVTKKKIYLFSDERYLDGSSKFEVGSLKLELKLIKPEKGLISHLQEIVKEEQIKTLGFEAEDLRFNEYQKLKESLSSLALLAMDRLIVKIREIKDEDEINCIQKACEIGDQCLSEITRFIKQGTTEKEIAFKIEMWLKERGHDIAFDPIVAIDANSAVAHYNTKDGEGVVKNGSVILIDFGVKHKDYVSDITRMAFFGRPSDEVKHVYEVLLQAQEKTVEKVADSDLLKDIDDFCRKLITNPSTTSTSLSINPLRTNNLPAYPHSTGHGVGLEIHEYPKVSFNSTDRKQVNQIFTIEPGVYFPGKFGMRIEDTLVVEENLKARTLTKFPKSLLII